MAYDLQWLDLMGLCHKCGKQKKFPGRKFCPDCLEKIAFFLMGLTVQKAVVKEEKDAKNLMRASQSLRLIMLLCFCAIGAAVPAFNLMATLIPLLFPRLGVFLRGFMLKKRG